ncbi:MAG: hypothetical protein E6248_00320 [Clostridium sp.]|uniref:hypothetical protein n=1 Tax=Clostridium sp. TaxID=1506 RepID=UPI002912F584|nr:hypothetical protein [Clostridium sp.]MDU5108860.1 hypothetical protein [Clostridium sp.]
MGKIMRELFERDKALELAREIEKVKEDMTNQLDVKAVTRLVAEQYKKNHLHCDQTDEGDNEKILNDILTDKLEIDNHGVYREDGQTIRGLDEV